MSEAGRPPFKSTPGLRRKVEELVCCGMSQDEVARAIGCSAPTLVKHFGEALTTGVARKRAEIIGMLFKAAKKGNVTAQKKLEEMSRVVSASESFERPARPARVGKKEEAAAAAVTAGEGTDWGDDLQIPDSPLN